MTVKLDPKVAEAVMLKAGLEPLEVYENSKIPWKCKCMKCGKIVTPTLGSVRQGRGGCTFCGYKERIIPNKYLENEAVTIMLKAGLQPLMPYERSNSAWKCRCLQCGKLVLPQLQSIVRGSGCKFCADAEKGLKKQIPSKNAIALMLEAQLQPLEPYSGSAIPWKCKCLKCGNTISPTYSNVRKGGRCAYCAKSRIHAEDAVALMRSAGFEPLEPYNNSSSKWKCQCLICEKISSPTYGNVYMGVRCIHCSIISQHEKQKNDNDFVVSEMLMAFLKPLEPYKSARSKWKCECLKCGKIVHPKYNSIQQGKGGCEWCGGSRIEPEDAVKRMLESGLKPLENYPGSHEVWKCQCLKCKRIVNPSYHNVNAGSKGCVYCYPASFDLLKPAFIYLITNSNLNSHKIGIGNNKEKDRIQSFLKKEWVLFRMWQFDEGIAAKKTESEVFRIVRKELKLPIYLAKEDMPITGGHTETVDADLISLIELEKIVGEVIKGLKK